MNSTEGNVLELDGEVEGNIYWPSSVETTYDGKPHSCVPEHHSCMLPLYNLQMSRTSEAYDPVERFQSHPETGTHSQMCALEGLCVSYTPEY